MVDAEGKLIDSISRTDLKGIGSDGRLFFRLSQSVEEFIGKLKQQDTARTRPTSPVSVRMDDTFETVAARLLEHRIHRVYVVDDLQEYPVSVVSLRDLLLALISSL